MISWGAIYFLLAIYAGFLGWSGVAGSVSVVAKILGVVFLFLSAISVLTDGLRSRLR